MKFSIIVPVYNVAPYLHECLDSVLAQTVNDPNSPSYAAASWEVICVDDGSMDKSAEILDEYASRDSRFRVIHQANAGVSSARNAGIDIASGDYLLFLDGDDAFVPWHLKCLAEIVGHESPADIVRYAWSEEKDFGSIPEENQYDTLRYDTSTVAKKKLMLSDNVGSLVACNGCFRRSLVAATRFKPFSHNEDILFGAENILKSKCVMFLNAPLYRYRVGRAGSATSRESIRKVKSVLGALGCLCAAFAVSEFACDCRREFSRIVMRILYIVYVENCKIEGREHEARRECVLAVKGLCGYKCFSGGLRHALVRVAIDQTVMSYNSNLVVPLNRWRRVTRIRGMSRVLRTFQNFCSTFLLERMRIYDS